MRSETLVKDALTHNAKKISAVAQQLLSLGYSPLPIFPFNAGKAGARGKAPAVFEMGTWRPLSGWQTYCSERPTPAELAELFECNGSRVQPNIGVALGLRDMFGDMLAAIDVDTECEATLDALRKLIPSAQWRRGRKGALALFLATDIDGDAGKHRWSRGDDVVEILGNGSQCLLPPSIHPATEKPYVWLGGETLPPSFDDLPRIARADIEAAIQALGYSRGKTKDKATDAAYAETREAMRDDIDEDAALAKFDAARAAYPVVEHLWEHPESATGTADASQFRLDLAGYLKTLGFSPVEYHVILENWDSAWGDKNRDDDDRARQTERQWTQATPRSPGSDGSCFGAVEDEDEGTCDAPPTKTKSKLRTFESFSFDEAVEMAATLKSNPLIQDVLEREGLSCVYGDSHSGKTWLMLDLAYHVATGTPWNGRDAKHGLVIYLAAEAGKSIFKRLAALKKKHGDAARGAALEVIPATFDFRSNKADVSAVAEHIRKVEEKHGVKAEFIVCDTLSPAMAGGDENSSVDMGALVAHADFLRERTSAHLALVHHTGKDKAKGARGHSILRAAVDTEIEIRYADGEDENNSFALREAKITKQRDGETGFRVNFRLEARPLWLDDKGRVVTSCTIAIDNAAPNAVKRAKLSSAETTHLARIRDAADEIAKRKGVDASNVEMALDELNAELDRVDRRDGLEPGAAERRQRRNFRTKLVAKGALFYADADRLIVRLTPPCKPEADAFGPADDE